MSVYLLILCVAGAGALGGLANCALEKEFHLPHLWAKGKIWRPGWIGNVLVGAVAAIAVWGIYGPLASYDLAKGTGPEISLTVFQLASSIIAGLSGGKILTLMAQRDAEKVAKDKFADMLKESLQKQADDNSFKSKP